MTDSVEVLSAELVPSASELLMPARGALAATAAPLLAVGERYAACQAAPTTQRTYRSTLRSFALFCERELGLPATVGAVTLDALSPGRQPFQRFNVRNPSFGRCASAGLTSFVRPP